MNAAVVILAPHTVPRTMSSPTSRRLLAHTDATDRPIAAPNVPPMIDPFIESLAIADDKFIDICLFTVHSVSIDCLVNIIYSTLLAQPCFTVLIPGKARLMFAMWCITIPVVVPRLKLSPRA